MVLYKFSWYTFLIIENQNEEINELYLCVSIPIAHRSQQPNAKIIQNMNICLLNSSGIFTNDYLTELPGTRNKANLFNSSTSCGRSLIRRSGEGW